VSTVFKDLKASLSEVKGFVAGKTKLKKRVFSIKPVPNYTAKDIVRIRHKIGVPQVVFAEILGTHRRTVEAWESGQNSPSGAAARLLQILDEKTDLAENYLYTNHAN
jgi:putative transcriptional regulator